MRDYAFNVDVAAKYGVDEAILIHAMEFWIKKNRSNERHFHDGRWWSYNSLAALGDLFPFWTKRQLERIISSCRDKGILYVGNYNEEKWKRTTWYALDDCIFEIYGDDLCISRNGEMQITNQGSVPTKKGKCISRNGEMHITKPGNACPETGKSISPGGEMDTILNPVYIPTVTPLTPQGAGAGFDAFWKAYPRKAGKKDALQAWKKLKPDSALLGM
ncbi:MAG: hypothetical protein EOM14_13905, partial [Clostridia bacterium]|nr:hypothetical protein [Clostridia bacterium]